ncbi:MAG: hypothetical protein J6334_13220 [Kiritimatiellae bacterium]|nr:hypothetical protein [Kiritimatiellia bacterium]
MMENGWRIWIVAGCLLAGWPAGAEESADRKSAEYPEFYSGDSTKGITFVQAIRVLTPTYCSYVKGNVTVVFSAKGMDRIQAACWSQPDDAHPDPWGHDVILARVEPDARGEGEFLFPADRFPHGPVTIRIQGVNRRGQQDYCELQLFNLGGVAWNQGIPRRDPPGAEGMHLVFADDFDGPLSISPDGRGARYAAHKTGGGDFSGWPFSDPGGEDLPFGQRDTFLRIHASKTPNTKGCTGILSSIRPDGTGIAVPIPSYFECRLIVHSAPGSWGAFWTLTQGTIGMSPDAPGFEALKKAGCDELDIIESYGGYGPKNPNHGGRYGITTHFWGQERPIPESVPTHTFPDVRTLGGKSSWSWTFHTYGLAITERDTVYYFDDIEVLRHPTGPVSKSQPAWFLINYAIGGISGWPIDLERYGNQSDMWVDWVRVYCGKPLPPDFGKIPQVGIPGSIGINLLSDPADRAQRLEGWEIAGAGETAQKGWNNVPLGEKRLTGFRDAEGKTNDVELLFAGETNRYTGEGWGFNGGDAKLKRGCVGSTPRLTLRGIPYPRYDLIVHLGAGVNHVQGDVALARSDGSPIAAHAFNYSWNGGKHVECTRPAGDTADKADNLMVFRGLTDAEVVITMTHRSGKGWSGIAGIQIIPRR